MRTVQHTYVGYKLIAITFTLLSHDRVDALYFLLSYNLYFIFILLTISVLSIVYVDYFPYLYKIL